MQVETTTIQDLDQPATIQAAAKPSWSDEQFVEMVESLAGSDQLDYFLRSHQERINRDTIKLLKDRVNYLVQADLGQAMRLAEAMCNAAVLSGDPVCEAIAQHAWGQALYFSGRHSEALEAYERAAAIYGGLGMEVESARIARAQVAALMYVGNYAQALALADKAREVFRLHNEMVLLAGLELNVGSIHHRLDQYPEALECFNRARHLYADYQDELGIAWTNYNCANQYTCLNEFERALTLYQEAKLTFEKLNMWRMVNDVEYSLAWLHFQRGNFQESLKLFYKVNDRAKELSDVVTEALCDLDLSEVYLRLNAHEDALESAQSAVQKFSALGMTYEHIKARMYVGIARANRGEYAEAEQELQAARQGFKDEGNDVFMALTDVHLSELYTRQHALQQALTYAQEAKEVLERLGIASRTQYAEMQLAQIHYLMGNLDAAQQLCHSVLAKMEDMESPWLRHRCLYLLGATLERAGKPEEAYPHYTQAVAHLESLRSTISVDEFKSSFLEDKQRIYEDIVRLCLRRENEPMVTEAFSFVEAAKSRALVELLLRGDEHRIKRRSTTAAAEALHHQWQQVREQLDWYYNRINHYELRSQQPALTITRQLRQEVRRRERELAKLDRRMRVEDAEHVSLRTVTRPDVAELRRYLAADEVLIEYYVMSGRIKAFALDRDGVQVSSDLTTTANITSYLRRLRFYMEKFTLSDEYIRAHRQSIQQLTEQCLHGLYAEVVEPIASWIEGRKILFVPHNVLHYVPFHALYDGRQHLIDRHEISYSPSATVWKWSLDKARKQSPGDDVLIMGIPDDAMPFIHEEVGTVHSLWPQAKVFVGEEATLDCLKSEARNCRLLHLASHAVFRRDNPMFSALRLSDSWLSFFDIFNLDLTVDLVTLSACETGVNEVSPGDELFGLMRGFLYAGAPSLIVSLWMVNDRSTSTFMRWLYNGLKEGLTKRQAIRQAMLQIRAEYGHPYYWAPFILMGKPT
ncbi:MAG: CHAT domain-containing protein [Acidobacteriota bacterium]|nr:CHAT domain-containing protein [Blastocatellia bacterium]MDW8240716.1 CHAT domain-containing protein [Acidobacteriota bacterium]